MLARFTHAARLSARSAAAARFHLAKPLSAQAATGECVRVVDKQIGRVVLSAGVLALTLLLLAV
jgi:hypothetical protein